jgi:hypothetical protein
MLRRDRCDSRTKNHQKLEKTSQTWEHNYCSRAKSNYLPALSLEISSSNSGVSGRTDESLVSLAELVLPLRVVEIVSGVVVGTDGPPGRNVGLPRQHSDGIDGHGRSAEPRIRTGSRVTVNMINAAEIQLGDGHVVVQAKRTGISTDQVEIRTGSIPTGQGFAQRQRLDTSQI